jgi:hypothetical protein
MTMLRSECNDQLQSALDDALDAQVNRAFDESIEYGRKLSQQVFLVNAGGAAAVLAYLGSTGGSGYAYWPLLCFLVGLVCGGVELRCLANFFFALHLDAMERRRKWVEDEIKVSEVVPTSSIARWDRRIGTECGRIAQAAFPIGVLVGLLLIAFKM